LPGAGARDSLSLLICGGCGNDGGSSGSASVFYDFCLDDHVPQDHQLRGIDRHLDLDGIRAALRPFYSSTGRPSIDPELMIRMLLVGYCLGIRSERRLCEEVHLNLAIESKSNAAASSLRHVFSRRWSVRSRLSG
jgi:transposase